jgi:hypothetical protein
MDPNLIEALNGIEKAIRWFPVAFFAMGILVFFLIWWLFD